MLQYVKFVINFPNWMLRPAKRRIFGINANNTSYRAISRTGMIDSHKEILDNWKALFIYLFHLQCSDHSLHTMTLVKQPLREGTRQTSAMLAGHSTTGAELVDHMNRNCENILDHQSYCDSSPSKRNVSHIYFFGRVGGRSNPSFWLKYFKNRPPLQRWTLN